MDSTQKLMFSSDATPRLLGFKGSVAERHVENLKIMRTIGVKKYIEACQELTADETLLRQKVYNFYNGPGIWLPPCY